MEIRPFDRAHLPGVVACVTAVWTDDNVIANALGVTAQEYRSVATRICQRALEDELGLMLIEPGTEEVMGFHTSIDLVDELAEAEAHAEQSPRMRRWADLLQRGFDWYLESFHPDSPPQHGEVLYMNIGGTLPALRSQGWINRMLMTSLMEYAIPRGYDRLVGIATHPHSIRKMRSAAAGSVLHEIPFASLDDPDLSRITEPEGIVVSATSLGPLRASSVGAHRRG